MLMIKIIGIMVIIIVMFWHCTYACMQIKNISPIGYFYSWLMFLFNKNRHKKLHPALFDKPYFETGFQLSVPPYRTYSLENVWDSANKGVNKGFKGASIW